MQTRNDEAERVQYWLSLVHQPGVSAWFTVWRVAFSRKPQPAKAAAKDMRREQCAA